MSIAEDTTGRKWIGTNPHPLLPQREPPHDTEIEAAVLGCILLNNANFDRVSETLSAEHFYDPVHADIFDCIAKSLASGREANPVTLKVYFEGHEPISDTMTVPQYLGKLATHTYGFPQPGHVKTIRDLAIRRSLIDLAAAMSSAAFDGPIDWPPDAQIEEAEARLLAMADTSRKSSELSIKAALDQVIEQANAAYQRGGGLCGLSTGLTDLDDKLGGLQGSDLIVLAGRPSMGKTALATNIAYHNAFTGKHVHFFSQEMSAAQLALRLLAEHADISGVAIRQGRFLEEKFRQMVGGAERIGKLPLTIDETGGIKMAQLAARARRVKRKRDTALIVVDYLQLMNPSSKRDSRVQDITEITMGLKALAKELNVPIIALSQLSRETEKRTDKRPQLSDLRESGSIEQDADVVMFVYRDDYYLERTRPDETDLAQSSEWHQKMARCEGKAEVIIGKQRHGPTGTVELSFEAKLTRFANPARQQMPERYR